MQWPHDAVLLPSPSATGALNASAVSIAGRAYTVYVAELDGQRVQHFSSQQKESKRRKDPYGRA